MPERKKKEDKRMKISGTIKQDQYNWIQDKIKEGKFYNISHILQEGIRVLQSHGK